MLRKPFSLSFIFFNGNVGIKAYNCNLKTFTGNSELIGQNDFIDLVLGKTFIVQPHRV